MNEADHVVYPNPETDEYQLADDGPLQQELQELAEYQCAADTIESHDDEAEGIAAADEHEEEVLDTIAVAAPWDTAGQYQTSEPEDPFAASQPVEQHRKAHDLSEFALGLGLYCIIHSVSRKQYSTLLQLLKLLGHSDKISRLPDSLDTLKRHVRESIPRIDTRVVKDLPLNPKKLSSSRMLSAIMSGESPTQDLFFLNPVDLLRRILSSRISSTLHFGMAQLVDNPSEAWHSMQWAGSVRTTSGEFAYYPPFPSMEPIFPGDILAYQCAFPACTGCHEKVATNVRVATKVHLGQIQAMFRDHRDSSRHLGNFIGDPSTGAEKNTKGDVVLVISRICSGKFINRQFVQKGKAIKINPAEDTLDDDELILSMSPMELISPAMVTGRRDNIRFDYAFGSKVQFPGDPIARREQPLITRIFDREHMALVPPCLVSLVPGALEVDEFGRDWLVKTFAQGAEGRVRCLPCLNFNDGFGLYRTMTKSIMGCYLQIAAMPRSEHTRQINVLPVTLGPHGANMHDVMKALAPLRALDRGIAVDINGERTMLCASIFALTGDMPQQQQNSGCLSVAANLSCRLCLVTSNNRDDLDVDVIGNARGHMEMVRLRRWMDEELRQKYKKEAFSTKHGISLEAPAVMYVAPALDLIGGRPSDAAHSEFNGITKMIHQLLLDAVSTPLI